MQSRIMNILQTFSFFPLISTKTVLQGSTEDPFPIAGGPANLPPTRSTRNENNSGVHAAQHSLASVHA